MALASMGIYVFRTALLIEELRRDADDPDSKRDFGGDIIPHIVKHGKAVAHRFSSSCVRAESEPVPYWRSEEHTSELQSLMRISYAVFCLKKKNKTKKTTNHHESTQKPTTTKTTTDN